ncbi:hypothetical protein Tco_0028773 [Tanacetum coccineum]
MVGITSKEEDASELFSGIRMSKNGSLFMCDGASWSTVVVEGEPIDSAGAGATTSAFGVMTSGVGGSILGTEIQKKDKNEAKTDKTEHEIGKGAKSQSQSQKVKVKNSKPRQSHKYFLSMPLEKA